MLHFASTLRSVAPCHLCRVSLLQELDSQPFREEETRQKEETTAFYMSIY